MIPGYQFLCRKSIQPKQIPAITIITSRQFLNQLNLTMQQITNASIANTTIQFIENPLNKFRLFLSFTALNYCQDPINIRLVDFNLKKDFSKRQPCIEYFLTDTSIFINQMLQALSIDFIYCPFLFSSISGCVSVSPVYPSANPLSFPSTEILLYLYFFLALSWWLSPFSCQFNHLINCSRFYQKSLLGPS